MQKDAVTMGSYVLIAAAFSAFVRWIQNQAAFELETGLAKPDTIWGEATFLFCLISVVGIVWLVRRLWYRGLYPAQTYVQVIHGKQEWLHRITRCIAGLMVIGAVIAFLVAGYQLYSSIVRTMCVLAIVTAWAFVKLNEVPFEEEPSPHKQTLLAAIPVIMYIYWLVVSYRTHAAVPAVWSYALEVFAISASILGMFFFAGYGFDFPRPYAALGWLMTGALLSLVTLLDSRNIGQSLMFVAGAAMQMYYAYMIITSMSTEWPEEEKNAE
ncbi:MAG: hypothetical protein IJD81_02520 [Oscillospiraceae bacterium]|nr:hypothetical protein [Oscillospiraceae bacterium]